MSQPRPTSVTAQETVDASEERLIMPSPGGDDKYYQHLYASFYYENSANTLNNVGMGTTLAEIFKISEGNENDIRDLVFAYFNFIANQTETFGKYYLLHRYYKRLFCFENERAAEIVRNDTTLSFLQIHGMQQSIHKDKADVGLRKYLAGINFTFESIAAPTMKDNGEPLSFIVRPHSDFFIPPKCNVIFSDQVSSASYSRNMLAEPTRVAALDAPSYYKVAGAKETLLYNIYVAPGLGRVVVSNNGEEQIKAHLTYQEHIRGINGKRINLTNNYMTGALSDVDVGSGGSTSTDPGTVTVSKDKDNFDKNRDSLYANYQRLVDLDFDNAQLEGRNMTIMTPYSPYRLVGMPMLYIDTNKREALPSVIGVIQSMSHHLSADGKATSQINVAKPRLLWDETVYDKPTAMNFTKLSEFFKTLGVPENLYQTKAEEYYEKAYDSFPRIVRTATFNTTGADEESIEPETVDIGTIDEDGSKVSYENRSQLHNGWIYQWCKNMMSNDDHIELRTDWYSDKYRPENIGMTFYQSLVAGVSETNWEPGTTPEVTDYQSSLADEGFPSDGNHLIDQSIMAYAPEDLTIADNLTKLLAAIKSIKNSYTRTLDDEDNRTLAIDTFSNQHSKRRLVDESSFWKFYLKSNSESPRPDLDKHYRDVCMATIESDEDGESIMGLYKDDNKEFKPFTFQHYSRVYDLKKSQFAHIGADLSDSDVLSESGFSDVPPIDETLNEE
tara:strand:+ start:6287 stop:8467 length:2181 start_codon:yes stop_codon:yes gene_type:complete